MAVYQMEASRSRPSVLSLEALAGATSSAEGSMTRRVKRSNCSAMPLLPVSATGTPELSAVDTVL